MPAAPASFPKFDIIIDSGAFSAWRLGKAIDLPEYCKFLKENEHWITTSVALDVINPNDPNAAAKASFDNYMFMRKQGLRPVPVFHVGEKIEWLFRLLDAGADYIGLSASSIVSRGKADEWYGLAWSHLVDSKGAPIVKAHAFGEGRYESLLNFPWYSADTTSWIYSSQHSGVIQLGDSFRLGFRNDGYSTRAAPDVGSLAANDKRVFLEILKRAGVDPAFLDKRGEGGAFITRCYLSALYYMDMERRVSATYPKPFHPRGFLLGNIKPRAQEGVFNENLKLHLVMGGNHTAWTALAVAKHPRVLASYFYIKNAAHYKQLEAYMYDPVGVMTNTLPFKKHYEILLENLTFVPQGS